MDSTAPAAGKPLDLGHLAQDIAFISRTLRAHVRAVNERTFAEAGVSTGQIALINLIWLNPGVSQNDLAAAVVVKKSAVTKAVSDLESRGLVARARHGTDRRMNALTVTPAGEVLMQRLMALMAANTDRILTPLSAAERAILMELLGRVVAGLAAHGGPVDDE